MAAGDAVTAIHQAKSEKPDLIMLDLGLPVGDGCLVMERLGNIDDLASIRVIVFTVREEESHRERAIEAGGEVFSKAGRSCGVVIIGVDAFSPAPIVCSNP